MRFFTACTVLLSLICTSATAQELCQTTPASPASFSPPQIQQLPDNHVTGKILYADFDWDGEKDLISVGNSILGLSSSIGSWQTGQAPGSWYPHAIIADAGSQGERLFVVDDQNTLSFVLLFPVDLGTFPIFTFQTQYGYLKDVQSADINGDGLDDIVAVDHDSFQIYLSTTSPTLPFAPPVHVSAGHYINQLVIEDVNKDGRPDFVTTTGDASGTGEELRVLYNITNGAVNFREIAPLASIPLSSQIFVGIVNRDRNLDISVVSQEVNSVRIQNFLGDGMRRFAPQTPQIIAFSEFVELDGGRTAAYLGTPYMSLASVSPYPNNHAVHVLVNNGTGQFSLHEFAPVSGTSTINYYSARTIVESPDFDLVIPNGTEILTLQNLLCSSASLCGNGLREPGEECDGSDGVFPGTACTATCELLFCGDGILSPALGEQCDDGNNDDNDGCTSSCTVEFCGDGIVQPGEECDGSAGLEPWEWCDSNCEAHPTV